MLTSGAYMPDLTQVVPAILQLSFLTSPIMFQASAVGELGSILMLNPLYWLLSLCRDPIYGVVIMLYRQYLLPKVS